VGTVRQDAAGEFRELRGKGEHKIGRWEIYGTSFLGLNIGGWCSSIVPGTSDSISPYVLSDSSQDPHYEGNSLNLNRPQYNFLISTIYN
jgi:hypothetical protein